MKRNTIFIIFFLVFLVHIQMSLANTDPYDELVNRINKKTRKWREVPSEDRYYFYNDILTELRTGIQRLNENHPKAGRLWFRYGEIAFFESRYYEASQAWEKAVEIGYINKEIAFWLIQSYRNMYAPLLMDKAAEELFKKGYYHEDFLYYVARDLIHNQELQLAKKWANRLLTSVSNKRENDSFTQNEGMRPYGEQHQRWTRSSWLLVSYSLIAKIHNELNDYDYTINLWEKVKLTSRNHNIASNAINPLAKEYAVACFFKAQILMAKQQYQPALHYLNSAIKEIKGRDSNVDQPHSQIHFLQKIASMRINLGDIRPEVTQKNLILFIKGVNLTDQSQINAPPSLTKEEYYTVLKKLYPPFKPNWGNLIYFRKGIDDNIRKKNELNVKMMQTYYIFDKEKNRYILKRQHFAYMKNISELFRSLGYTKLYKAPKQIDEYEHVIQKSVISYKTVKTILEVFSRGKFSLQFKEFIIDAEYTRKNQKKGHPWFTPDYDSIIPYPSEILYEHANYDSIWFFFQPGMAYPGGRGGVTRAPIIPYHLNTPARGHVSAELKTYDTLHSSHMSRFELCLHEYFHSIEGNWELAPHLWRFSFWKNEKYKDYQQTGQPFSQWTIAETREYPYYDYIFTRYLARKNKEYIANGQMPALERVLYAKRFPFTMSRETFLYNLKMAHAVSLENRRKSYELYDEAKKLQKKGKKEEADRLIKNAYSINPAFYPYYLWYGKIAEQKKDFRAALDLYQKYVGYTENGNYAYKIALWHHYKFKDYAQAVKYYEIALRQISQPERKKTIMTHLKKAQQKIQ